MPIQKQDGVQNTPSRETEYVESFERLKRKNLFKRIRRGVVYTFLMLMLLFVFVCIVAAIFFRIGTIEIKCDSVYDSKEILAAVGVENGDNILLVDENEMERALVEKCPFVKGIKLTKSLPSKLKIEVECDIPSYYTEIGGEYFLISDRIRVLAKSSGLDELIAPYQGVKKLRTSPVARAVVGEKMIFKSDTYSETLENLLSELKKSEVFEGITSVDASDKFNISAIYEHRLKAMLGSMSDIGVKLMFLNGIVNDLGNSNGTIDIKDAEIGYVLLSANPVYE